MLENDQKPPLIPNDSPLRVVWNSFSYLNPFAPHQENVKSRRQFIRTFKAKANAKRSQTEKFADWLTSQFGSVWFLGLNATWFFVWISINTGFLPWLEPFDPFPFGLLTMVVSLEAIFLAIIVLISQNREARVADLREEIELQLDTVTETEMTKLINLVVVLMEHQGIKVDKDPELRRMLKPVDGDRLEKSLEKELDN